MKYWHVRIKWTRFPYAKKHIVKEAKEQFSQHPHSDIDPLTCMHTKFGKFCTFDTFKWCLFTHILALVRYRIGGDCLAPNLLQVSTELWNGSIAFLCKLQIFVYIEFIGICCTNHLQIVKMYQNTASKKFGLCVIYQITR